MPITEHDKLGVHARPSDDSLVVVPFKKRRFLFTRSPSPPPQLSSSAPEDCDAQCKPESSGLESPFSETCGHPEQADAVTGNKCAVTGNKVSSDLGEEVKDTDVNVSPTPDTFFAPSDPGLGQHVEANSFNVTNIEQEMVIDNKILSVMGSSQPLSVMQETLEVPQKVGSDEGKIVQSEGTLVMNNNTLLVMRNTQTPSEMQKTFEVPQKVGSDEGKIVRNEGTSVLDNEVLPVMGSTQPPAVTQATLDVAQKVGSDEDKIVKSEWTLVLNNKELPVMGSTQPAAVTQETLDVPQKVGSDEEKIIQSEGTLLAQKVGSSEGKIVQSEGTLVLNNKVLPVIRSTQPPAVMQETLDATQKAGRDEGKPFLSEGIPVKVDNVEHKTLLGKSGDTELKVDSGHLSLNRSNWDLNTTMDTWEGSKTDFAINHGTSTNGRLELDDMHNKGLEFGVKDSLYKGPSGANLMLGNHSLQTNGHDNKLLNLSTVVTAEHSDSVACLGLQLKPSFLSNACATSANLNTIRELPYLSLSVKPTNTVSSHIPQLAISVAKPEPFESDHQDTRKVDETGGPNSLALKNVKSEPCEGHESTISSASDLKSVCSIILKQEPLALSQGCYKSPEGKSTPVDLVSHGLSCQSTNMHQNAGTFHDNLPDPTCKSPKCKSPEGRAFQMELGHGSSMQNTEVHQTSGKVDDNTLEDICKPLGLDEGKLQSNINDPSTHKTGVENMDSQLKQSNDFPLDTVMPNAPEETASKPLHIAMRPMVSDGNEFNSMKKLCETDNLPPPHEPMVPECKEHTTADGMPESVAYNSSEIARIQNENGKVVEINETKDNISPGTHARICEFESKVAVSHDAAGAKPLHKQCGAGDEDYEDGEVADRALLNERPHEESDVEQVKDISSVGPVDVPAQKAALAEEKEIFMHNTSDVKGHGIDKCEIASYYEKDVQSFSSAALHNGDSAKSQPNRIIHKLSKDDIKKHKDPEREAKSDIGLSTNKDIKGHQADANNQQEKPEGSHSMLVEFSELCKTGSSQADGAAKDVTSTGQHSRIIYLNSASNKLASERMKCESGRSSSSHIERGSPTDRSFNHEKSHSRGSRDEPSKFGVDRRQFYQAGRQVTDFMCNRGRTDERLINLNGDKNTDSNQLLEHGNRLNGVRFPRRLNDTEIDNAAASDGFNRKIRKRSNDEFQNLSRMPCRGLSSGARGQGMMGHHPIRDISPGRRIGREVPDFVLAREDNLMRNLPDGMMEPTIPPHLHSQYERSEGIFVRRERQSLSPSQRRGVALNLPANCSKSYPRAQQRSPHQWTAPGRCPDGYTGPPELVRCRSPEMVRLDRMRSLHQRPCFQDEMVVRRRASPPYSGRQSDDVIDMVPPTREHNFPRHLRGSNRNMGRFNLIDPREIAEEDYFELPLPPHEFAEEEEYADDRRCEERRGPIRSFRQRCAAGDEDDGGGGGENYRFHVDDGPRTFRLCPENNEGFPEAGSPRDFNGRFRNRLGNRSGRLRDSVQEQDDNYRHHEGQGWEDAGYADVRMKRRRF
ncbi:uncharacterized protein M6B38_194955 [Iris pallida]|uniref:Uncharacterized protein n=1 Tax=Iris pallida TaxID=29817 RepID=A0AAX6EEQ7_IRIPA|nr:uncharacterized protein M6B38_194955 [Iris pallida]